MQQAGEDVRQELNPVRKGRDTRVVGAWILPGGVAERLTLADLAAAAERGGRPLKGKIGCVQVKEANSGEVRPEGRLQATPLLPGTTSGAGGRAGGTFSFLFINRYTPFCSSGFTLRCLHQLGLKEIFKQEVNITPELVRVTSSQPHRSSPLAPRYAPR